ncbi:MAG: anti-sigma-factor antagonist [Frankiales bacterium]|jgi:anti-anti-sigma factor|nr:anti-sigma-factor antagonist [Frankiales bacterium]
MPFDATLSTEGQVATITLTGELDAAAAPAFRARIEEAAGASPERLVLMAERLSYMSSAGLRSLVFAKQKMGQAVDIYIVAAQDPVIETIRLTGFDHSVIMQEAYVG